MHHFVSNEFILIHSSGPSGADMVKKMEVSKFTDLKIIESKGAICKRSLFGLQSCLIGLLHNVFAILSSMKFCYNLFPGTPIYNLLLFLLGLKLLFVCSVFCVIFSGWRVGWKRNGYLIGI